MRAPVFLSAHQHDTAVAGIGSILRSSILVPVLFFSLFCLPSRSVSAQELSPKLDTAVRYVGHYRNPADSVEVIRLMEASFALPRARRDSALILAMRAADLAEASVENGLHADAADSRHWAGRHALNQGKPELAEQAFRRELEMRDKLAGPDHPDRANCIDHLGRSIRSAGNPRAALPFYQQALALRQRYYAGADHPDLAGALNNLALVYSNLGRYSAADSLYSQSLAMKRRIYKEDDIDLATTINNLGLAELEQGKLTEGAEHLEEGVAMLRRTHTDKPVLAAGLAGLARAYYALGRYDTALTLSTEAAELRSHLYRGDHPALASSDAAVGRLLWKTGNRVEGEKLLRQSLAMSQRLHPEGHPFTASAMVELGTLLRESGNYGEARSTLTDALAMRRKELEGDHPHIAAALIELARAQIGTGNTAALKESQALLAEGKTILEKNFSGAHPLAADLHRALGELALARGNKGEARQEYEEAAMIMAKVFPAGHPDHAQLLKEISEL